MRERHRVERVDEVVAAHEWRRLGIAAAWGMLVWAGLATVGYLGPDPFVAALAVLYGGALYLQRREGHKGAVVLVVLSGLVLLLATFAGQDLLHPESWRGFMSALALLVLGLTGFLSGVAFLRAWSPVVVPRLAASAVAVLMVGLMLSVGSTASVGSHTALDGDLRVVAEGVMFTPSSLEASAGTVSLFVENEDRIRHTVTVPALGVDVELPASTDRRVSFQAAAGTYDLICAVPGHERMVITLTVGG